MDKVEKTNTKDLEKKEKKRFFGKDFIVENMGIKVQSAKTC